MLKILKQGWRWQIAILAGAAIPFSFVPYDIWPLAVLGIAIFSWILHSLKTSSPLVCAFCFGLGFYITGAAWLFNSINDYGTTPFIVSLLLWVMLLVALSFVVFAVPIYVSHRWFNHHQLGILLGVPAVFIFNEWLRTWFLGGFPWLFLGYGHLDTWLAGWAPVVGVIGISFVVALSGSSLAYAFVHRKKPLRLLFLYSFCLILWIGGAMLESMEWTQSVDQPKRIGIAQGNIPQEKKWLPSFLQPTLDRYVGLTEELKGVDWIIWPEAAIPLVYNDPSSHAFLGDFLNQAHEQAEKNNAALILGILYLSPQDSQYYNSIMAMGLSSGIYFKQRLVPVVERQPPNWTHGTFQLFNLPYRGFAPGASNQPGLQIGTAMLAPSICYEIAYPDHVARGSRHSNALITFFDFPGDIRRVIYTTNAIESLSSVIRKSVKTRKLFPSDESATKVVYLAIQAASKKWTMPIQNWKQAMNHFMIEFEEQLAPHI